MTTNNAPFTVQPRLTQIAMSVAFAGGIADQVCPRIPVEGEKFVYTRFKTEDMLTPVNDYVTRTGQPNRVEFGATDTTDSTEDHALDAPVPNKDIESAAAANANFDPEAVASEQTAMLIELNREIRVANLYTTLSTYDSSLRTTLSGTSQWSDYTNSDPITAIDNARDSMIVKPNIAVMGQLLSSILRKHPKVVAAVLAKQGVGAVSAASGKVSLQALADFLELDAIYVGESFVNSAKPGQTAIYARAWGKDFALLRIERNVKSARTVIPTFAFTAQFGGRISGTYEEAKVGIKGGRVVRVGEQVKELICFRQAGYLFKSAAA